MDLDNALNNRGLYMVILSRVSPVVPFSLLGFVFGLTSVEIKPFIIGTTIGLTPGVFLYSWMGINMRKLANNRDETDYSLYFSIVLSVVSIIFISR